MKIINLFKTKKVFLLSLIIPAVILVFAFLNYKDNPVVCGNSFTVAEECKSFVQFLSDTFGFFWAILTIMGFVISFLATLILFLISNENKKV